MRNFLILLALTATSGLCCAQNPFTALLSLSKDNDSPYGTLVLGKDGNFYGTTINGGPSSFGTFFDVTPNGTLTTLYSFPCSELNCDSGYGPQGIVAGRDGNFYGVTLFGGVNDGGTVFRITPQGALTTLYSFCEQFVNQTCLDGNSPNGPLVQGRDGNFYGTTYSGGSAGGTGGAGTVFKITPGGTLTTLYSFCQQAHCFDGQLPMSGLIQGRDGNFYGTTFHGGPKLWGTVFRLAQNGSCTVLHSFDQTDGAAPESPLIQGSDGNLYGTTFAGGSTGYGTVFKMTTTGTVTTLANLNDTDEASPGPGPLIEFDGNFYGTTVGSGLADGGSIFKITPSGSLTVVHDFCSVGNCLDGRASTYMTPSPNGVFYGTTEAGGTFNAGLFFSFDLFSGFLRIAPASGVVGTEVTIKGTDLSGATAVRFSGTPAKLMIVNKGEIKTTVPSGVETGSIVVGTSSGTLVSDEPFEVKPQILSFLPTSGPPGTRVTITGVSLKQTTRITFGGVGTGVFHVNSDSKLTATVPRNAATGPLKVGTRGGTSTSSSNFAVTP